MGIQHFSDNVLLVRLPEQPQQGDELEEVSNVLSEEFDRDVIVDFCEVKLLTSEMLCRLIVLERLLMRLGRVLILCNISGDIKHVFIRTGLVSIFEFAKDEHSALQKTENRRQKSDL